LGRILMYLQVHINNAALTAVANYITILKQKQVIC